MQDKVDGQRAKASARELCESYAEKLLRAQSIVRLAAAALEKYSDAGEIAADAMVSLNAADALLDDVDLGDGSDLHCACVRVDELDSAQSREVN